MAKKPAAKKRRNRTPKKLTPMQRLFALEYIVDLNATKAAVRAGFSEKTAAVQGHQLLKNPLVAAEIERQQKERLERIRMDADGLLVRLFEEADADMADLIDENGGLKDIQDWPPIWRKGLIAGIELEEEYDNEEPAEEGLEQQGHGGALKRAIKRKVAVGRVSKIKISDRVKRLELIGRHIGVGAWRERKLLEADEPLRRLAEEIAGRAIRPKEE